MSGAEIVLAVLVALLLLTNLITFHHLLTAKVMLRAVVARGLRELHRRGVPRAKAVDKIFPEGRRLFKK